MARAFPTSAQTEYFYQPGALYQGLFYAHDPRRDLYLSGYIREVPEVAQVSTATVTWGADGDGIGFTFDGVTITAFALTDDNTSAAALNTAIQTYITANPDGPLASTSVLANVVTVTFSDFLPHDVPNPGFATGTSAVATALSVAAASYARLDYGLGVTLDSASDFSVNGAYLRAITGSSAGTDELLGVLGLFPGAMNSAFTVDALGFDSDFLMPGRAYDLVQKGSVVVPWVGTLPTGPTDQVYWINDPATEADRNKFRSDANGGEADLVSAFVEGVLPDENLVKVKFDL